MPLELDAERIVARDQIMSFVNDAAINQFTNLYATTGETVVPFALGAKHHGPAEVTVSVSGGATTPGPTVAPW